MEHEEEQLEPSSVSPLPVIPRLDRLDRLLQLLEEKMHRTSDGHLSSPVVTKTQQDDGQYKALSSALQEVHHKGTLMERLSILENRVLQLSLEMDERRNNTSRSSSSTALVSEIWGQDSVVPKVSSQHEGEIAAPHLENEGAAALQIQEEEGCGAEACNLIKPKRRSNRKWIGWFGMGCC